MTIENELDIRGLFHVLWIGKLWILGMALGFALLALVYTFLVKQEWSVTAIIDNPTVSMLGNFYSQRQFLRNLDINSQLATDVYPSAIDESYKEFIIQLASWDARRDFWLQTDYYKQRMVNNNKTDAKLLYEFINNIQFIYGDVLHKSNDSIKLIAETAVDAKNLLLQYVSFVNERTTKYLNNELKNIWDIFTTQMQEKVKRQEEVAHTTFLRQVKNIKQALIMSEKSSISHIETNISKDQLSDSEIFLMSKPMLKARLENLQIVGPNFDLDYEQNCAMLNTLNIGPKLNSYIQAYRYLRTPEEPIKIDSPRRMFLMIMWGILGALVGAGMSLTHSHLC